MRWLLGGPRPPKRRFRFSRILQYRIPLLILLLAATIEVFLHTRKYAVHQPHRELDLPFATSCQEPKVDAPRENAAIVMLARNSELEQALHSIVSIEKHFNQWYHYPVVFLNDEKWDEAFIETMKETVSGEARFEVISKEEWLYPKWMDQDKAKQSIAEQGRKGILYAGMETYHHMCRFFSGKFYTIEALRDYKWYWRVEPDVDFHCSITYDPFAEMAKNGKVYGFTISLREEQATCPGLFRRIADWKESHHLRTTELWKAMIAPSWMPWPFRSMMSWFGHRDKHGDAWSLCHYWSNFEIADLDFFRGHQYQSLYQSLERSGGFYYERWGDAAVHSLAVAMLLDPHQVHHFEDFGYRHDDFYQCPANAPGGQLPDSEILGKTSEKVSPELQDGIGCRCECDGTKTRNIPGYCLAKLKQPNTDKKLGIVGWAKSWYW
ncbi:family 15 putative glycosyltransferase [Cladorrhinum sp. PSN332]|nr:family 15 putative glycosyltransferase [Cladorrhinum sp. PSN332]